MCLKKKYNIFEIERKRKVELILNIKIEVILGIRRKAERI
jgi:hypothetical protein